MSNKPAKSAATLKIWTELGAAARQLQRQRLSSLLLALLIGAALLLPAFLLLLQGELGPALKRASTEAKLVLFFEQEASDEEAMEVSNRLQTEYGLELIEFQGGAAAASGFATALGISEALEGAALPASASYSVAQQAAESTAQWLPQLEEAAGVSALRFNGDWLERLASVMAILSSFGTVLGFAALTSVCMVVYFSASLAVELDRDRVELVKLVGAGDLFAARPFIYRGLLIGLCGGLICWLSLVVLVWLLQPPLAELAQFYEVSASLPWPGFFWLLCLPASAGAAAAASAAVAAWLKIRQIRL